MSVSGKKGGKKGGLATGVTKRRLGVKNGRHKVKVPLRSDWSKWKNPGVSFELFLIMLQQLHSKEGLTLSRIPKHLVQSCNRVKLVKCIDIMRTSRFGNPCSWSYLGNLLDTHYINTDA